MAELRRDLRCLRKDLFEILTIKTDEDDVIKANVTHGDHAKKDHDDNSGSTYICTPPNFRPCAQLNALEKRF